MEVDSASDSASATLQDLTGDWSYFEKTEQRPKAMPQQIPGSPTLSSSSSSISEWHTSDYASSTSSEADKQSDMDATRTDSDPTIVETSNDSHKANTYAGSHHRPQSLPATSEPYKVDDHKKTTTDLVSLTSDTETHYARITVLESSILQALRAVNDFNSLSSLQESLLRPIHGSSPVHSTNRFAEENLPPYDRAIVAVKLEKLHELETVIQEGCQRYEVIRNLLATSQWTRQQALKHWDNMCDIIACNKERSAADHLLATIPFQKPKTNGTSANTKRRGKTVRESLASESHLRANERAKTWRGHMRILENHLQVHLRVFGSDALPELPKEVFRTVSDLQIDQDDSRAGSLVDGVQEHRLGDDEIGGNDDGSHEGEGASAQDSSLKLVSKEKIVKSHSKKALQVLGIKN